MERVIALRSKVAEFHGLEREFIYFQSRMLSEYEESKDIKHPRDVGDARENILRDFLTETGLIPERYGVSKLRARVVAPSGHSSKELDLVFFDRNESVALMCRNQVVEYYSRESVYGAIQVKSCMNKAEIVSAFENLASFKSLYDSAPHFAGSFRGRKPSNRGFTIVFAFDSNLDFNDVVSTAEISARSHPPEHWPNAIVVLSKGICLFGTIESQGSYYWSFHNLGDVTAFKKGPNQGRAFRHSF